MSNTIILIPLTSKVSLKNLSSGLVKSLNVNDKIKASELSIFDNIAVEEYLSRGETSNLLEEIIAMCEAKIATDSLDQGLLVTCGLPIDCEFPYAHEFNKQLTVALNADVVFVFNSDIYTNEVDFINKAKIVALPYLQNTNNRLLGYIVNSNSDLDVKQVSTKYHNFLDLNLHLSCLGCVGLGDDVTNKYYTTDLIDFLLNNHKEEVITPPLFCHKLVTNARKVQKRIVLPEGDEPRTIQASNICASRGLAKCVLLGEKNKIMQVAKDVGVELHKDIEIIEPQAIIEKYVDVLYEIRKDKGMTIEKAREQLQDTVVLGTMMLQLGEVDGLVSGAVHTTANTIRPAFQIIKTTPDTKIISSVFFVCLPDQVLVYGDCAINPNPTAEELADIAIKSADSAKLFGIEPRVAMLSYSTGTSGIGPDVEKVRSATNLAKERRPDLAIEGPIQYDAGIDPDVAKLKMPNSAVAGRANVFIFPDLNSGNIGYKALQRATKATCIGPMLQGMRKPVNDLSRGCLVEDIVFTIILTAIQAN